MAVNLVSTPDVIALSRGGRTRYAFQGDARLLASGAPAITYLIVNAPIPDGTELYLKWGGTVHKFTFRNVPEAVDELPTGSGSGAHADAIAGAIGTLFIFRKDFVVSRETAGGDNRIVLEARQPGPGYEVTADFRYPDNTPRPANKTQTFRTGVAPKERERYGVYVEVRVLKTGAGQPANFSFPDEAQFETAYTTTIEADVDGNAYFDAGKVLHSLLRPDLGRLAYTNAPISPDGMDPAHTLTYYIAYAESYGAPVQVGRVKIDRVRWMTYGGLDYEHAAEGSLPLVLLTNPVADDPTLDRALRGGPNLTRFIRPDEPQFLSFINTRSVEQRVILKVKLRFDGQPDTVLDLSTPQLMTLGSLVHFPAGPAQFDPDILDFIQAQNKPLLEYSLYLVDAETEALASVYYRYVINYRFEPYVRHFVYLNSLGGWDTLTCFGKGTEEWQRTMETAERTLSTDYQVRDGQFVDYDVSLRVATEVSTGFLSAQDLLRWADFYRSAFRYRFRVDATGYTTLPISVTSKGIKQTRDGDNLIAHRFEYIDAFRQDWITEIDPNAVPSEIPPPGFVPGGPIDVTQPLPPVPVVDNTVPQAAREFTNNDLLSLRQLKMAGSHKLAGYLTQSIADALFLRSGPMVDPNGQPIQDVSFARIAAKPPTAAEHGIEDVYTKQQIETIIDELDIPETPLPEWWKLPIRITESVEFQPKLFHVLTVAKTSPGSFDNAILEFVGGGRESSQKVYNWLQLSNAGYFRFQYELRGAPGYGGFRGYLLETGELMVFACYLQPFGEGYVRVQAQEGQVHPTLPPYWGETPPGTLVLDTLDPDQYLPIRHVQDGISRTRYRQIIDNMTTTDQLQLLEPPRVTEDMKPYLQLTVRDSRTGDLMPLSRQTLIDLLEDHGFVPALDPQRNKKPVLTQKIDDVERYIGLGLGMQQEPIIIAKEMFEAYRPDQGNPPWHNIVIAVSGLPTGLAYNDGTVYQGITGTTNLTGEFEVIVRATDNRSGLYIEVPFELRMVSPNRAPVPPQLETYQVTNGTIRTITLPPFTDPDPGDTLQYAVEIEGDAPTQAKFSFDSPTRRLTIAADTPARLYKFLYKAVDPLGLAAAKQGELVVATGATEFKLTQPDYVCETRRLKFNFEGGDGTPVTFWGPGITGETLDPVAYIDAGVVADQNNQTVTLFARQSGKQVSLEFNFRAVCSDTPVLAKPVSPGYEELRYTLNQIVIKALARFTHPDTTSITHGVSGLPEGVGFNPANMELFGFAKALGEFTAIVTATANLGSGRTTQEQDSFKIIVGELTSTLRMIAPTTAGNQITLKVEDAIPNQDVFYKIIEIDKDNEFTSPTFTIPANLIGKPLTLEARQGSTTTGGTWTPGVSGQITVTVSMMIKTGSVNNSGVFTNNDAFQVAWCRVVIAGTTQAYAPQFAGIKLEFLGNGLTPFAMTQVSQSGDSKTYEVSGINFNRNAGRTGTFGFFIRIAGLIETWTEIHQRPDSDNSDEADYTQRYQTQLGGGTPTPPVFTPYDSGTLSADDPTIWLGAES